MERTRRAAAKRFSEGFGIEWGMAGHASIAKERPTSPAWFSFGEEKDPEGNKQTQRAGKEAWKMWSSLTSSTEKMKDPEKYVGNLELKAFSQKITNEKMEISIKVGL